MTANPSQNYVVRFAPGDRIFSEGDIGTTMFVVQSGEVRLFRGRDGTDKTLATMEKGDFFGEMSVLEGLPRTSSAEAASECELIEINSMTFDRMIRGNIEIAVRMLRKLSIRLREAEKTIERLQTEERIQPAAAAAPARETTGPDTRAAAVPPPAAPPAPRTAGPPRVPVAAANPTFPASPASPTSPPASPGAPAARPPATPPATQPRSTPRDSAAGARGSGPRLVSEAGETVFPLSPGDSLIGRFDPVTETQPEVDLTTLDLKRSVSRRHARITVSNGAWFLVEEIGALNGTFLNGQPLVTGKPAELRDGDTVALGTVRLFFRL